MPPRCSPSKKPHCENCTHQTRDGVTTYFHSVLAAKVVTSLGLVVPLAFEFIENPGREYDKQDCEIKAWRRLAGKIRRLFPRLKINLVGDGLYAEEPTFNECEDAGWNFVITLTDNDLPTVNRQLPDGDQGWSGVLTRRVGACDGPVNPKAVHRTVRWKTPVTYHGEIIHVIEMEETDEEENRVYCNRWITNVKPDEQNAFDLAQTGRLRWRIENEGTNTQKNGGYEMGHLYGRKQRAWKNYYLVLQISQLLNDLTRFGDYIQKITGDPDATFEVVYGTMREFAEALIAHLRNRLPVFREPGCGPACQIRLAKLSDTGRREPRPRAAVRPPRKPERSVMQASRGALACPRVASKKSGPGLCPLVRIEFVSAVFNPKAWTIDAVLLYITKSLCRRGTPRLP